jgi:hypothetical protein
MFSFCGVGTDRADIVFDDSTFCYIWIVLNGTFDDVLII